MLADTFMHVTHMKDYKMDIKKYLDQTGVYKMVQVSKT